MNKRLERLRAAHAIKGSAPAGNALDETDDAPGSPAAIELIPLDQLRISTFNVREANGEEDIEGLADSIHELGLISNLAAHPELGGTWGVFAGGRRLRALWRNRDLERIPADWPVPVRMGTADQARELSMAENVHRLPMNPVDEFEAYARLVADHAADEDPIGFVAKRFQKTRAYVEQRLRLQALAPEILDALRAGEIRLESGNAYAGVDDHALQCVVFRNEEARAYPPRHEPRNIRDQLRSRTYPANIRQAIYVGLEAYEAAGGRRDRDLFMGSDEGELLLDPSILDRLAREKAEEELPAAVKRDGFGSGRLVRGFASLPALPQAANGYMNAPAPPFGLAVGKIDLARDKRAGCIGIYGLSADHKRLACVSWWVPVPPPIEKPRPQVTPATKAEIEARIDDAAAVIGGAPARDAKAELEAAQALALQALRDDGGLIWPTTPGYLSLITYPPADAASVLVAVQVRISRADFESAIKKGKTDAGGN